MSGQNLIGLETFNDVWIVIIIEQTLHILTSIMSGYFVVQVLLIIGGSFPSMINPLPWLLSK